MKKIGYLVVIAGIVFGVGLLAGWWNFSKVEAKDGKTGIALNMSDKAKSALNKVKDKAKGVVNKVKDKITGKDKMKSGTIDSISIDTGKLGLKVGDETIDVDLKGAKIQVNGADAALADLKVGDKIEVTLDDDGPMLKVTR